MAVPTKFSRAGKKSNAEAGIGGSLQDIALAAVASTIPMLSLAAALLIIVYTNRVEDPSISTRSELGDSSGTRDSSVLYIDYDATRLATIASWASSVAFLLPGFIMTLFWYHVAHSFQHDSQAVTIPKLPTPYQLGLLLALKSGGLQPLWDWIVYLFSRRRERQTPLLTSAGGVLLLVTTFG